MTSGLMPALQITLLGMGLVFGAILLLWGMMALLTAIPAEEKPASDSPGSGSVTASDDVSRAAAIAVAVALAERQLSSAHPLSQPPTIIISAWQLSMRTRQMYEKGIRVSKMD